MKTARLSLHCMEETDAAFIFELVNDADFKKHIGDKGIRTLDDARAYIRDVPMSDYRARGYGGYLVRLRESGTPVGICGLYKRANLDHPDLGFALAAAYRGSGYATECARAVISHAESELGLQQIAAVVSPGNRRSMQLVEKLGFERWGSYRMPGEDVDLIYYRMFLQA